MHRLNYNRYYIFTVSNYDPESRTIEEISKKIPQAKEYVKTLVSAIANQKQAALSGDKAKIVASIEKGAQQTKSGAAVVKSNPTLYKLTSQIAPEKLEDLAAGIKKGKKTAADENKLLGEFDKNVGAAIA